MSDTNIQLYLLSVLTLFGAALGSFLNVVIGRMATELSIVFPGSRCPRCLTPLKWYENVPILAWFVQRGRCRHCGTRIAFRYVLLELITAVLVAALFLRLGLTLTFLQWLILSSLLVVIVFYDIDYWIIPDRIVLPGAVVALIFALLPEGIGLRAALWGLIPAGLIYATGWVFERVTGKEGLGFGDVKLLLMLGLALGLMPTLTLLFLASVQGVLAGIVVSFGGGHPDRLQEEPPRVTDILEYDPEDDWEPPPRAIPFGPFLALGAFEVVLLPEIFLDVPRAWVIDLVSTTL
ncbi:MAG: prepilin peptidase [Myxococcota bacterium]